MFELGISDVKSMCCDMKNVILIFFFGEQNVIYVCFSSLTTTTELL